MKTEQNGHLLELLARLDGGLARLLLESMVLSDLLILQLQLALGRSVELGRLVRRIAASELECLPGSPLGLLGQTAPLHAPRPAILDSGL